MDWQATVDAYSKGAELLRDILPEGVWLNPTSAVTVAAVGIIVGLILALWGAKLLRFVYVAVFIFAGAYAGIQLARNYEIDDLFGLVVGAALAGLLGHFLFRWWVGITTGFCSMILAAAVVGPQMLPQLAEGLDTLKDQQRGVGTGDYSDLLQRRVAPEEVEDKEFLEVLRELRAYAWEADPPAARKLTLVLAFAWLAGLALGIIAPRFTTIWITSILGVGLLAASLMYLLATRLPTAWVFIRVESGWFLATLGLALLVSLAWQFRSRRPIAAPPAVAPAT